MALVTLHRFLPLSACTLLCGLLALGSAAWASGEQYREQDRARAALQAGQVLPLKTVLERLERTHPGQVLEQDQGRWIYEIKLLETGGRLLKLKLDARNAQLLPSRSDKLSDKR